MNQKHLAGFGGGLFLALFGIIVSFSVFQGLEEQFVVENGSIGFSQLGAISDGVKNTLENNIVVEEFKEIFGDLSPQRAFTEPLSYSDDSDYNEARAFDDVWEDFEHEYGRQPTVEEFSQHVEKMIEGAEKKLLSLVAQVICIDESGEYTAGEKQEMCEFSP
jgi:cytochrome c556